MYDDLKDKRVVVTGDANGIGYATVRRFIRVVPSKCFRWRKNS